MDYLPPGNEISENKIKHIIVRRGRANCKYKILRLSWKFTVTMSTPGVGSLLHYNLSFLLHHRRHAMPWAFHILFVRQ